MSHGRFQLHRAMCTIRSGVIASILALAGFPAAADHALLGSQEPSAQEQEGLWTLNRARNDPARYGQEIQFDLSTVLPRPPLALNRELTGSARFHAEEMLGHDYFAHVSQVTGDGPNLMGYDLFGMGLGFDWGTANQTLGVGIITRAPAQPVKSSTRATMHRSKPGSSVLTNASLSAWSREAPRH